MSEKSKITVQHVREFLKFLIDNLTIFKTDDEGYIRSKVSENYVTIDFNKKEYKLLLFTDIIPDSKDIIVLNPLNESLSKFQNKEIQWFYMSLAMGLSFKIITLVNRINEVINGEEKEDLATNVIDFISKYTELFDDKFMTEFDRIKKDSFEFMNVYFNNKKEAVFRSSVFEDTIEKLNIRKKTKTKFKEFICELFNVKNEKDLQQYRVKATSLKCPQLQATLEVYNKIYSQLNKYFMMFDENLVVDTEVLQNHISLLEEYYEKTKWLVQSTVETKATSPVNNAQIEESSPLKNHSVSPVSLFSNNKQENNEETQTFNGVPIMMEKPITTGNPFGMMSSNTGFSSSGPPLMNPSNPYMMNQMGMGGMFGNQQPMFNQQLFPQQNTMFNTNPMFGGGNKPIII